MSEHLPTARAATDVELANSSGVSPDAALLATVTRGSVVESMHFGHAVALALESATPPTPPRSVIDRAWGDPAAFIYPRSSAKPVQALAMLRHGLQLPLDLLALACSSHSAEAMHRSGVDRILDSVGLTRADLHNTPGLPLGEVSRREWIEAKRAPEPIAQDCSGKHAAMLATCVIAGWSTNDYLDFDHPLQQRIRVVWREIFGAAVAPTRDGCGAPLFGCSTTGLALGYQHLATSDDEHCRQIHAAMSTYPQMVGGTGRFVTDLMQAVPGLIAKDGAEAIVAFAHPNGQAGAIKVLDGGPRGMAGATGTVLHHTQLPGTEQVRHHTHAATLGHGKPIGSVLPVE